MSIIEQIKNSFTLFDLCNKAGLEIINHKVKSIYKTEKTPSLHIFPDGRSFKDFSSGIGGDVINFYEQLYNVDRKTAIKELAQFAGISNDEYQSNRQVNPKVNEAFQSKDFLQALSDEEKYFYEERAAISNEKQALDEVRLLRVHRNQVIFNELYDYCRRYESDYHFTNYLNIDRKLDWETIAKFKLFYIGNYFEVNNHLRKQFDVNDLRRAGIVNEKGNLIFAKHRIIIPYITNGQIIYLRGRFFDQEFNTKCSGTKYIGLKNDALGVNTAKRLFNLSTLKTIWYFERVFIVEGEFDAMILEQNGFNSIAIPGVGNLPEKQLKKLLDYDINICVDNDDAGKTLENNLTTFFHKFNKTVTIKSLPDKIKDITDFYKGTA